MPVIDNMLAGFEASVSANSRRNSTAVLGRGPATESTTGACTWAVLAVGKDWVLLHDMKIIQPVKTEKIVGRGFIGRGLGAVIYE